MKNIFYALSALALLLASCNAPDVKEQLVGKWQPVGDNSRILEFTPEGYYNLFVGNMNIFEDIEDYGRIKYQLHEEGKVIKLQLMDEKLTKEFVAGQIEIVDQNHISIAFYQDEGEINVKEAYERIP